MELLQALDFQYKFTQLDCKDALMIGPPGCGKTYALVLAACKNLERADYRALLVAKSPWTTDHIQMLLPHYQEKNFGHLVFPSGAQIYIAWQNFERFWGASFDFLGVDTIHLFSEQEYKGLRIGSCAPRGIVRANMLPKEIVPKAEWVEEYFKRGVITHA